jgi:hypothetical protein
MSAAAVRQQIVHRTPIVVVNEMRTHFFERWVWSFIVTLQDGSKHQFTGVENRAQVAGNAALRAFGKLEEKGVDCE